MHGSQPRFAHARRGSVDPHSFNAPLVPRAACTFYTYPTASDTLPVYEDFNLTWAPTCRTISSDTVNFYLYVTENETLTAVHEWANVDYSAGTLRTQLKPTWWNASNAGSVSAQLTMTLASAQMWDTTGAAGPTFTISYNGTYPSVTSSDALPTYSGPSVEDEGSANVHSTGVTGGKLAAAIVVPIVAVIALIAAVLFWRRRRAMPATERYSQAIDQRMSMVSQGTYPAVGQRMSFYSQRASHYSQMHSDTGDGSLGVSFVGSPLNPSRVASAHVKTGSDFRPSFDRWNQSKESLSGLGKTSFDHSKLSLDANGSKLSFDPSHSKTSLDPKASFDDGHPVSRVSFAEVTRPGDAARRSAHTSIYSNRNSVYSGVAGTPRNSVHRNSAYRNSTHRNSAYRNSMHAPRHSVLDEEPMPAVPEFAFNPEFHPEFTQAMPRLQTTHNPDQALLSYAGARATTPNDAPSGGLKRSLSRFFTSFSGTSSNNKLSALARGEKEEDHEKVREMGDEKEINEKQQ